MSEQEVEATLRRIDAQRTDPLVDPSTRRLLTTNR
jgi:hypothetical protein